MCGVEWGGASLFLYALADACLRAFERGAVADADTCSLVLASLLSSQQSSPGRGGGGGSGGSSGLTHAVRMLAHMREMRVLPTNVAVKQMLLACNRMAEVDVALKLWRDLRAQGFRPSAHNCTLMIQTFDSVEQEGVEPGLEILIALLDAYGKGSLWSRVDELLSHISKEGLRKAPQVQTSLMVIYGRAGMFDKMNAEVALMRQTTPVLTLAEGLVGYMRERFNVKYMHFNAILAVYARAARWDDVAAWLARVRMAGIRPSLGNYNRIAFSFPHGRADLWERLLGEMRRDRVRPSFNTYRGLLGTHVHAARFGAALGVYRASLSKHPLLQAEPDLCPSLLGLCWWHLRLLEARQDVYNTLLEVHASAPGGGLSECVRLLCELEATGRTPDVRTFLSLITAFGHAGHYPEEQWVREAVRSSPQEYPSDVPL
eukprot:jgi/Mesen1/7244/ME000373S06314